MDNKLSSRRVLPATGPRGSSPSAAVILNAIPGRIRSCRYFLEVRLRATPSHFYRSLRGLRSLPLPPTIPLGPDFCGVGLLEGTCLPSAYPHSSSPSPSKCTPFPRPQSFLRRRTPPGMRGGPSRAPVAEGDPSACRWGNRRDWFPGGPGDMDGPPLSLKGWRQAILACSWGEPLAISLRCTQ